jgi:hypothetical protein
MAPFQSVHTSRTATIRIPVASKDAGFLVPWQLSFSEDWQLEDVLQAVVDSDGKTNDSCGPLHPPDRLRQRMERFSDRVGAKSNQDRQNDHRRSYAQAIDRRQNNQ